MTTIVSVRRYLEQADFRRDCRPGNGSLSLSRSSRCTQAVAQEKYDNSFNHDRKIRDRSFTRNLRRSDV